MLRKIGWSIALFFAHLIPAKAYKAGAIAYLRFKRDGAEKKSEPNKPVEQTRFTMSRLDWRRKQMEDEK